jgi:hypothetical protein
MSGFVRILILLFHLLLLEQFFDPLRARDGEIETLKSEHNLPPLLHDSPPRFSQFCGFRPEHAELLPIRNERLEHVIDPDVMTVLERIGTGEVVRLEPPLNFESVHEGRESGELVCCLKHEVYFVVEWCSIPSYTPKGAMGIELHLVPKKKNCHAALKLRVVGVLILHASNHRVSSDSKWSCSVLVHLDDVHGCAQIEYKPLRTDIVLFQDHGLRGHDEVVRFGTRFTDLDLSPTIERNNCQIAH